MIEYISKHVSCMVYIYYTIIYNVRLDSFYMNYTTVLVLLSGTSYLSIPLE